MARHDHGRRRAHRARRDRVPQRPRRRSSNIAPTRCPLGKTPFRTHKAALGAGRRIGAERAHGCKACGCWHITLSTRGEYDALQARYAAGVYDDEEQEEPAA